MRDLIDAKMNSMDKRFESLAVVLYISLIILITILVLLIIKTTA